METPNPADFPKYVENATKTATTFINDMNNMVSDAVVDGASRAQEQYSVLFEQAQEFAAGGYKTVADGYKSAVAKVDFDAVPGAETVRPYINQATEQAEKVVGQASELASERLTVPAEWVDTYFEFAHKVIDNQRQLTDRVMDNQRQLADRVFSAATAGTATAEKATKSAVKTTTGTAKKAVKSTQKAATGSTKKASSTAKKTVKKTSAAKAKK